MLSALAKGYAICDHWFSSAPTETLPNRAFALAATSRGHMDDKTRTFTSPSIFGLLGQHNIPWGIYGYQAEPLTRSTFTDIASAPAGTIGKFSDFAAAAAAGSLPAFCFLEPSWSSTGNGQHPAYDVALGEQLTLTTARTDDVLAGVTVPVAAAANPAASEPSHLQEVQADLISRRFPAGQHDDADTLSLTSTNEAYATYIRHHSETGTL